MGASGLTAVELGKAVALLGDTQEDFGKRLGVRHATVSRWLGGKVEIPGYVEAWLRDGRPEVYRMIKR